MSENEKGTETIPQDEIILKKGGTEVEVLPKGAMIASFKVEGEDILFPDQYIDTPDGQKRRGGNPLLFPQGGPITEETDQFQLAQHGFARNKRWEVDRVDQENGTATLKLASDEETKRMFPYEFEAKYTIEIEEGRLRTQLDVTNNSDTDLPIAPGFHPYFHVSVDEKPNITTNIPGFNPKEYDWKTPKPYEMQHPMTVNIPNGELTIDSSSEFKTMMVWSEPNRPYVCLEPWVGDVNAILHEDQRLNIPPGETESLWMEISFEKAQQ
ncbi:hypothetical protein IID22_03715 [Patescibacteria group bacterium]|nr:hypothetical protein [Patescibacteria group bacterium]